MKSRSPYLISLAQKPFDLLNCLEYLHLEGKGASDALVLLIGNHVNVRATEELCKTHDVAYERLPEPDLYFVAVQKLIAKRVLRRVPLLLVKGLLLAPAYLWWLVMYAFAKLRLRSLRCDVLMLDAWRSKCLYATAIHARRHVLTDGGYATLHYGLCEAFTAGGARALIQKSLSGQRPPLPALIQSSFARQVDASSQFFTCYFDRLQGVRNVVANAYRMSQGWVTRKEVGDFVMIMGIPALKHIDDYLAAAMTALPAGTREDGEAGGSATPHVHYRFHPTDRNRASLDDGYRRMIEEGVAKRGVDWSYPQYSLEFDFLTLEKLPRAIVSYESSSAMWLQTVFGEVIKVSVLPLR
ncbi:MAG: hypothetical protein EOP24_30115 [Hyphomicrobiales bacterium]|nr:MAG: hypothetical protein EOP24_30115 [Hyphomicrobiales bacterium]